MDIMKNVGRWWLPKTDVLFTKWIEGSEDSQYKHRFQVKYIDTIIKFSKNKRTIVDVGANIGLFSYAFSQHFSKVHSFEPVPINFECLDKNISFIENIVVHKTALGSESGVVKMMGRLANTGSFQVVPDSKQVEKKNVQEFTNIPIITLDSLNLTDVDAIKIDCEGFEFNVICGAIETIKRNKPLLAIEFTAVNKGGSTDTHNKVKSLLVDLGYVQIWAESDDAIYSFGGQ